MEVGRERGQEEMEGRINIGKWDKKNDDDEWEDVLNGGKKRDKEEWWLKMLDTGYTGSTQSC